MRSNRTELALLGLLADGAKSGYDLKKEISDTISHFWSESYGQIYPTLKRLRERDLVVRKPVESTGGPDRFVYSLTVDGWAALHAAFQPPAQPPRPRNELLLRLFFAEHCDPELLLRDVRSHREHAAASLARFESLRAELGDEADLTPKERHLALTVDYGVAVMKALVDWSNHAERTISS